MREQTKETGADGIAVFDLEKRHNSNVELFASAMREDRRHAAGVTAIGMAASPSRGRFTRSLTGPRIGPRETVN